MSAEATAASRPQAAALLDQVLCSRAAVLARGGALGAAADLLRTAVEAGSEDVATLDLLARIRAQAGEWAEAERLWLQVARLQPGHAGAAAGLVRLRRSRSGLLGAGPVIAAGGVIAAALIVAAALHGLRAAWKEEQRAVAALQAAMVQREEAERDRLLALDNRLAELAASQQSLTRRLGDNEERWDRALQALAGSTGTAVPLRLPFRVAGVQAALQGATLRLELEGELFDAQDRLLDTARGRLRTLARAIVMMQERVVIEVAGIAGAAADDVVARQRAERAAAALRETGLFPRHAIRPTVRAATPGSASTLLLQVHRRTAPSAPGRPTS